MLVFCIEVNDAGFERVVERRFDQLNGPRDLLHPCDPGRTRTGTASVPFFGLVSGQLEAVERLPLPREGGRQSARGKRMTTVVPFPISLSMSIEPPARWTMVWTEARPRPLPSPGGLVV